MKKYLLISLIIFINFSFAQQIETNFISKTKLIADQFIGVDELNNIFYINNNVLFRKNKIELLSYNSVNLGEITSVNILNPFKIILFYKEFNTVIILDNKLSELTNPINFTKETLFNNVQFLSLSSENDLWLLADDNKIHLYDYQNHVQKLETQPLGFYQEQFVPTKIKSTYKYLWVFSDNGVLQFNEYGSFIASISLSYQNFIQPDQNGYFYKNNNSIYYLTDNKISTVQLDLNYPLKAIYVNKSSIYTFDGTFLYQYNIL